MEEMVGGIPFGPDQAVRLGSCVLRSFHVTSGDGLQADASENEPIGPAHTDQACTGRLAHHSRGASPTQKEAT